MFWLRLFLVLFVLAAIGATIELSLYSKVSSFAMASTAGLLFMSILLLARHGKKG